jgi:AcrR family transcriptional regulator
VAVGTSSRLLIFHFGSKERLLVEVLGEMQSRLQRSLSDLLPAEPGESRSAPLRQFWDWALKEPNFAQLRVAYQLHILAAQDHKTCGKYLKRNSLNWLELVLAVLKPAQRSPTLATLIVAVFDGLFIEVMSTGDRRRASAAMTIHSPQTQSCPKNLTEVVSVLFAKRRLLHFSGSAYRQRVQEDHRIRYPPFRDALSDEHQNFIDFE